MGAYDAMGTNDDAAVTNPALKASGISLLKGIITKLGGAAAALGQATMANSAPVVIASDQSAVPVSGTVGVSGNVEVTNDVGNPLPVSGTVTANAGTGTMAGSVADGADVTQGAKADAAQTDQTQTASAIAFLKGIIGTLKTLVVLAAGENHIGAVGGHTLRVTSTFTRPANTTAYASGQLVANNTVANSVVPLTGTLSRAAGKGGMIRRVKVKKSGTVLTNAQFRVHFYTTNPTQTGGAGAGTGDGAVWSTDQAGTYAGSCDVTIDKGFTDGAAGYGVPLIGSEINFTADTFYWLLEARAAYTPISAEAFVVDVEVLPN